MKKNLFLVTVFFATAALAQEQKTVHAFSLVDAVNYAQILTFKFKPIKKLHLPLYLLLVAA
jgi:hypothetical protein